MNLPIAYSFMYLCLREQREQTTGLCVTGILLGKRNLYLVKLLIVLVGSNGHGVHIDSCMVREVMAWHGIDIVGCIVHDVEQEIAREKHELAIVGVAWANKQ